MLRSLRDTLVGLGALLIGCGSPAPGAAAETAAHGQAHHHHGDPASLRPLMTQLRSDMSALRAALADEDAAVAAQHARAIAIACDDEDVHLVDPERFGPRFAEIDGELHGHAAQLADAAEAGDLELARTRYAETLASCNACHAQAPSAGRVDLTSLAP